MVTKEDIKTKVAEVKDEAKFKCKQFGCWVHNNKDVIAICAPIVVSGLSFGGKVVKNRTQHARLANENRRRDLTVYDPSTGCYLNLRRKLNASEKVALATRGQGVTVTETLNRMGLLK